MRKPPTEMNLAAKVAHVTGAGAGIGRAIALRLAAEGANVVVSDVDEPGGQTTVERIDDAGGRAAFVRADVSSEKDVEGMIAFGESVFGGLDILVNNAGGAPEPYFPDAEPSHWIGQIRVNLLGLMLGTHYAIETMRAARGGAILNVSSQAGIGFAPHPSPEYAAAKAAVARFTSTLGPLSEVGIRVNCICPDWVETEKMRTERLQLGEERWAQIAPAELVQPEAIAEAALRLVSDESLAGRIMLCPHDGEWGLVPLDEAPRIEPLRA